MKAALYQGKGNIELTHFEDPACTDDAVYKHGTGLGHKITIDGEFGDEVVCKVKEVGRYVKVLFWKCRQSIECSYWVLVYLNMIFRKGRKISVM